jgi:hypothetical protein
MSPCRRAGLNLLSGFAVNDYSMKKSGLHYTVRYVCDKIRTRDLLIRSQTLYPAELHTQINIQLLSNSNVYVTAEKQKCQ